jgi:putative GTP pyrophosphokinase
MTGKLLEEYETLFAEVLAPIATRLQTVLHDHLAGIPRIDRISTRAKSPARFAAKALKLGDDGLPKYTEPFQQIQDQVGARVTVFYKQDVVSVSASIEQYFRNIEVRTIVPDSEWRFGYFGKHYVLALPKDAIPSDIPLSRAPTFFEMQVKTLWQHAWSEAEHDLGYKATEELSDDQKRRLAFTAAQAWGADRVFQELFDELAS